MDCPELIECSFMENSIDPKRAKRYVYVLDVVTGVIGHAKPCITIVLNVLTELFHFLTSLSQILL